MTANYIIYVGIPLTLLAGWVVYGVKMLMDGLKERRRYNRALDEFEKKYGYRPKPFSLR